MENSNYPSIAMWELEQLVKDTSLSNRYKGNAYGCLTELLQFLQTHSVLDVLGSCRSKFVKLLQDVRSFAFDKAWLDNVERCALLPDIQISQDVFKKLLDSKHQVSKEVEVLRFKIEVLSQNVEDLKRQLTSSETVLKSIIQKETQVLETRDALSAPLGYWLSFIVGTFYHLICNELYVIQFVSFEIVNLFLHITKLHYNYGLSKSHIE